MPYLFTLAASTVVVLLAGPAPAQTGPGRPLAPAGTPAATTALASTAALPTTPAVAPQTVQLQGTVRTPDGKPCAGASVYPAGAMRQLVITDSQGNFSLPVPAGSSLILRVEYFGTGSSRLEIPRPSTTPLAITLGQ